MKILNPVMSLVPAKLRMPFLMLGMGLIVIAGAAMLWLLPKTGLPMVYVVVIMAVALGLLAGLLKLIKGWQQKRKAKAAEGDIIDAASGGTGSASDPGEIAKLDQLDKQWKEGYRAFCEHAGDARIATLPWIVVAGEPGSGKTEAIRHSQIGFPTGLNKPLQGTGGTVNMDWWFANDAILLDTAGRLMFAETREWNDLLKKLNRARPRCPINGMLLFVPIDSLLSDTAEQIEDKASRIAQQLEGMKRELGIRFPVYVIVSKCDRIPGFREFFAELTDPELQHQILGWSNPGSLDDPFSPDQVDEHLASVRTRLRRRRLSLLLDPPHIPAAALAGVPNSTDGDFGLSTATFRALDRRIDHVDALYIFPDEMMKISKRLRLYMEKIFMPGPWTQKPPFVRGIFFTSSMQEGRELDTALADLMGVSLEAVPEVGGWRKDTAYFIKDVLTQKVFPEKGLISRATNASQHYLRNKLLVNTVGVAVVAMTLLAGVYAWWSVDRAIGSHANWWADIQGAAEHTTRGEGLRPVLVQQDDVWQVDASPVYGSRAAQDGRASLDRKQVAPSMTALLRDSSSWAAKAQAGEIRRPLWLRPAWFVRDANVDIAGTHAELVRSYAISPILRAATSSLAAEQEWSQNRAWPALGETMRIEQLARRSAVSEPDADSFDALLVNLTRESVPAERSQNLASAVRGFDWRSVAPLFPADEHSEEIPSSTAAAVNAFKRYWENRVTSPTSERFESLRSAAAVYRDRERALLELSSGHTRFVSEWTARYGELEAARASLDELMTGDFNGLVEKRRSLQREAESSAQDAFAAARAWLPAAPEGENAASDDDELSRLRAALTWRSPQRPLDVPAEFNELDAEYLRMVGGRRPYEARFARYRQASDSIAALRQAGGAPDLIRFARAVRNISWPDSPGDGSAIPLLEEASNSAQAVVQRERDALANAVAVPRSSREYETMVRRHSDQEFAEQPVDFSRLAFINLEAGDQSRAFDYRLIEDVVEGWDAVGQPEQHRRAYSQYLAEYERYWNEELCNDFKLDCGAWQECRIEIGRVQIEDIEYRLQSIEDVRMAALGRIGLDVTPARPPSTAAVRNLRRVWSGLPEEPRQALARLRPEPLGDYYYPDWECGAGCDIQRCYWRKWIDAAATSVAKGVRDERQALIDDLRPLLRPPLVCGRRDGSLTARELTNAHSIIQGIVATGAPSAQDDAMVPEILRVTADPADHERWSRLEALAKWLADGGAASIGKWGNEVNAQSDVMVRRYEAFSIQSGEQRAVVRETAGGAAIQIQLGQRLNVLFGDLTQQDESPVRFGPWEVLGAMLEGCTIGRPPWQIRINAADPFWIEIDPIDFPGEAAWLRADDDIFRSQGVSR